ncbi:MAG: hypothetical protein ABEN55_24060, partial [Bradymonadaceae bacterium]
MLGPRAVSAQSVESGEPIEATFEPEPERGALGKEIGGAVLGYYGGAIASMGLGLVAAKLIPPSDNNYGIMALTGAVGANIGCGLGAAAAGNNSGGTGRRGFAILGPFAGQLLSGLIVGGVGGLADRAGATGVRNVTIAVGVPLTFAATMGLLYASRSISCRSPGTTSRCNGGPNVRSA